MTTPQAQAYKPKEAAKALGIGINRMYELLASGQIRAVRQVPRTQLVSVAELERWLREKAASAYSKS